MTNHEHSGAPPDDLFMAAKHNTFRGDEYPAYHRMDVRINRESPLRGGAVKVYLHVINLYDQKNPP